MIKYDTSWDTDNGSPVDKVTENRMRRVAKRQGLRLRKNPARDPRALHYGMYRFEVEDEEVLADHALFGVSTTAWYNIYAVASVLKEPI